MLAARGPAPGEAAGREREERPAPPQEPGSRPTLATPAPRRWPLDYAPVAAGRGCARGSPPPSATPHGTRPAPEQGAGTFEQPESIAGRSRPSVLPHSGTPPSCPSACSPSLRWLGVQTKPELGTAAFCLISSPRKPNQERSAGAACDRRRVRPPRQSLAAGAGCGN